MGKTDIKIAKMQKLKKLANGAISNWTFLNPLTDVLLLNFWHLSQYVPDALEVLYKKTDKAKTFKDEWCYRIKHSNNEVNKLIDELKISLTSSSKGINKERIREILVYLKHQKKKKMNQV
jgi:hypothetical protein